MGAPPEGERESVRTPPEAKPLGGDLRRVAVLAGNRATGRLLRSRRILARAPAWDLSTPEILNSPQLKNAALSFGAPAVRQGQKGEHIRVMKTLLVRALPWKFGATEDPVEGKDKDKYGPETVRAVEVLQRRYNLKPINGASAGRGTLRALDRACAFADKVGASVLADPLSFPANADAMTVVSLLAAAASQMAGEDKAARGALFFTFDRVLEKMPVWRIFRILMALRQSYRGLSDEYWDWSWSGDVNMTMPSDRVRAVGAFVTDPDSSIRYTEGESADLKPDEIAQLKRMANAGRISYNASTGRASAKASWDVGGMFALPTEPGTLTEDQKAIVDEIRETRRATARSLYLEWRAGDWGNRAQARNYSSTVGRLPTEVDKSLPDSFVRKAWKEFGTEGSAAAINTNDTGRFSYGVGWAATGELASVFIEMAVEDPQFMSEVFQVGMSIAPVQPGERDFTKHFHVVDTDRGIVLQGHDAMLYLQSNDEILSALIASGEARDHYQKLLDSQWAVLRAKKFYWLDDLTSRWHRRHYQLPLFAAHAMHWAGSFTIAMADELLGADDNVNKMIWGAMKISGHFPLLPNGARIGSGAYASVIFDLGKDVDHSKPDEHKGLILNYVGPVTVVPADFNTSASYKDIAFVPTAYGAAPPKKAGDACRLFWLSEDLD